MADPRQAWENMQKNLQRLQQQGKRYVARNAQGRLEDGILR